jgi:hypothetical protein
MPRGGAREGAGGKSEWKTGKTKVIRVPESLAEEVLDYARRLDGGEISEPVTNSKTINLSGVSLKTYGGKISVHVEDLAKAGYEIQPESLGKIFKSILHDRLEN